MKTLLMTILTILMILPTSASPFYSVIKDNENFKIVEGKQGELAFAWGAFDDGLFSDGWGKLSLFTHSFQTSQQAYAAGLLEGTLTKSYILNYRNNLFSFHFGESRIPTPEVVEFLLKQYNYTQSEVQAHPDCKYWQTAGRFLHMLHGVVDGFNKASDKQFPFTDFLILQAFGDLFDIIPAVTPSKRTNWFSLDKESFEQAFFRNNHCSSIIKLNDDLSDIYMGHNSWFVGNCMTRVYKFYQFGNDFQVQFSSYPATLYSGDDYYILEREDQKMFVTETTNSVFNVDLFQKIVPETLLCWQRVLLAHSFATSGEEWTEIFKKHNSGTYNDQYIVADTKKFQQGYLPQPGFLWIVEQLPTLVISKDVTSEFVKNGNYWASFNVPFIKEIYELSGYAQAFEKHGDLYSHDRCPRANIFRREHGNVQSLEAQKKLLRFNDYKNDPFSLGNPTNTISARGDLMDGDKKGPFFAYDAKTSSWSRIVSGAPGGNQNYKNTLNKVSDIVNGPTHDQQPVFSWSASGFKDSHDGQPDVFDFEWITVNPQF